MNRSRTECLKLLVAVSILTCSDVAERAETLNKWIEIAIDTKTALGNLYGFCGIMLGLCLPQVSPHLPPRAAPNGKPSRLSDWTPRGTCCAKSTQTPPSTSRPNSAQRWRTWTAAQTLKRPTPRCPTCCRSSCCWSAICRSSSTPPIRASWRTAVSVSGRQTRRISDSPPCSSTCRPPASTWTCSTCSRGMRKLCWKRRGPKNSPWTCSKRSFTWSSYGAAGGLALVPLKGTRSSSRCSLWWRRSTAMRAAMRFKLGGSRTAKKVPLLFRCPTLASPPLRMIPICTKLRQIIVL